MKTETETRAAIAKESQGPPEAGRGRKDLPLEPPEGAQPCPHLDVGLPASRTGRE